MKKVTQKYTWFISAAALLGGLVLHQNCGQLVATSPVEEQFYESEEGDELRVNMIRVKNNVELQLSHPNLGESRITVGGPVVGYDIGVAGSAKTLPAVTPIVDRSITYYVTVYGNANSDPNVKIPTCTGQVMTAANKFNFRCGYGLDLLRRRFPGALYAYAYVTVATFPTGGEGDQSRIVEATASVRLPLTDESIHGDTNGNRYIDIGEVGNGNQGFRCAIFVDGVPKSLYPWNYDPVTGDYNITGPQVPEYGYRCLEKSCVGDGEYQAYSPEYPCCAGLSPNLKNRCAAPTGTGVAGDTNQNSVIDGNEIGSYGQAKLTGFACGAGALPRFRANMKSYPTNVSDFYMFVSTDYGYKCVQGVRLRNLEEGDYYGAGYNWDLIGQTGNYDAGELLQMEASYHGCGTGLVPSERKPFGEGSSKHLHYTCIKATAGSIVGDRNQNGKIDVFYRNVFAPNEFNPEIGLLSQGATCGMDSFGKVGTSWTFNYQTGYSMRTATGLDGYMCRPNSENCVPDGGYQYVGTGYTCCAGLTLQNNTQCVASRLEKLRTLTGGSNIEMNWDQWAYYYRPLPGASNLPDFLVYFPGVANTVRADRKYKADLFVNCVESNECGALRTLYGVTGTTSPGTTTTTIPTRDRLLAKAGGNCPGGVCTWDLWNYYYYELTFIALAGPEAYVTVSPDKRTRTIPVDAYVDCVTRSLCNAAAQLYAAGAPVPTTTTTTMGGGGGGGGTTTTTTQPAMSVRDQIYSRSGNAAGLTWDQWGFYYQQATGVVGPGPDGFFDPDNVKRVACSNAVGVGCLTVDEWYNCAIATAANCAGVKAKIGL